MTRLESVLAAYDVALARDGGIKWGKTDCLHFALEGAIAAGGKSLFADVPRYRTEAGALRRLLATGARALDQWMDARAERIAPAFAPIGAVAFLAAPPPIGALGLVIGRDAVFLCRDRLTFYPRSALSAAWRL